MTVRKAQIDELDGLMMFFTRMNEVINVRNNDYDPDNEVYPPYDTVLSAIENGELTVGTEDGVLCAACIVNHDCPEEYLGVKWQVEAAEDEFSVLHALRVAPEYEGRGFARQMISHVVSAAAESGQKAMRLDVLEGYSVEQMYLRMGFKYVDTVELYYADIGYPKRFRLLEMVL